VYIEGIVEGVRASERRRYRFGKTDRQARAIERRLDVLGRYRRGIDRRTKM
jgi:hypothetical protein